MLNSTIPGATKATPETVKKNFGTPVKNVEAPIEKTETPERKLIIPVATTATSTNVKMNEQKDKRSIK